MGFLCNKQKTVSVPRGTEQAEGGTENKVISPNTRAGGGQQGYKSTVSTAAFQDKQHHTAIKERKTKKRLVFLLGGGTTNKYMKIVS